MVERTSHIQTSDAHASASLDAEVIKGAVVEADVDHACDAIARLIADEGIPVLGLACVLG